MAVHALLVIGFPVPPRRTSFDESPTAPLDRRVRCQRLRPLAPGGIPSVMERFVTGRDRLDRPHRHGPPRVGALGARAKPEDGQRIIEQRSRLLGLVPETGKPDRKPAVPSPVVRNEFWDHVGACHAGDYRVCRCPEIIGDTPEDHIRW